VTVLKYDMAQERWRGLAGASAFPGSQAARPARLLRMFGALPREEAEKLIALVVEHCERIDAE